MRSHRVALAPVVSSAAGEAVVGPLAPWRAGYLALGANLGDRAATLARAVALLPCSGLRVTARSSLYRTRAVAPEPQPDYLNAVLRVETTLAAPELLGRCLDVERALGRVRRPGRTAAPRSIDIDVLLLGEEVHMTPGLQLPHPRLLERAFVRVPLAEVALPGLRHPVGGDALDVPGDPLTGSGAVEPGPPWPDAPTPP